MYLKIDFVSEQRMPYEFYYYYLLLFRESDDVHDVIDPINFPLSISCSFKADTHDGLSPGACSMVIVWELTKYLFNLPFELAPKYLIGLVLWSILQGR